MVRVKPNNSDKKFIKAKVEEQVDVRSYRVQTEDGRVFRRNRKHLYKTSEDYNHNILPDTTSVQQQEPQTNLPATKPTKQQAPANTSTATEPIKTRSGRVVRKPLYLKDYVTE